MRIGANFEKGKCSFAVWAPFLEKVELKLCSEERLIPMENENGYWLAEADVSPGTCYLYRIDGEKERPDPASCFQPEGVYGASQVIDHSSFKWEDLNWKGKELSGYIIYELHAGCFTREGSFTAIIPGLDELKDTGINAIELMPVAQFPGERNWGYDGVYLFAVQNSYGGVEGFKRLVNECHKKDICVVLDVVYNHLGHEGNYLDDFAPYFTEKYKTPWGKAVNFDGAYSNDVRNFFIQNAFYWFENYHVDALRLDAVHAILDTSAKHFLQELAEKVEEFSRIKRRKFYLIAESDLNDSRVVKHKEPGGFGIDAQWCDDFHHSLHALLTGEEHGYYADFGKVEHLVKSLREGFVYSGQYSMYRKREHGSSSKQIPAEKFIVFSQNHDQTGNRMLGERLSALVSFESLKLAAGMVLLSPYIPLLFMGEEYAETSPFLYFTHHSDLALIEAMRKGRKDEFRAFKWAGEPPDPQNIETFLISKIKWELRKEGEHKILLDFYKKLIKLRKQIPALSYLSKDNLDVCGFEKFVFMRRWKDKSHALCIFNFSRDNTELKFSLPSGKKVLDSSDVKWNGKGTLLPGMMRGHSFALYLEEK